MTAPAQRFGALAATALDHVADNPGLEPVRAAVVIEYQDDAGDPDPFIVTDAEGEPASLNRGLGIRLEYQEPDTGGAIFRADSNNLRIVLAGPPAEPQ